MIAYLTAGKTFSVCFAVNKDRYSSMSSDTMRKSIAHSISMTKRWVDADKQQPINKDFELLQQQAIEKRFNAKLLADIVLATAFASVMAHLIAKHTITGTISWFPDRDKITSAFKAIAYHMFSVNFSALCQKQNTQDSLFRLGIRVPGPSNDTSKNWYDDIVRVPDFIAGTIAAWDMERNLIQRNGHKFVQILEQVVADNQYLHVIKLKILEGLFEVFPVEISRKSFA